MNFKHLLFTASVVLAFGCSQTNEPVRTTISGEIINPENDIVTFRFKGKTITDTLNEKNQFETELNITVPTEITFGHGTEFSQMYVRPGDQLFLKLDPAQFDETLTYTGIGSENNNYKAAMVLMEDTILSKRELYMLEEDSFLVMSDYLKELKLDAMDAFGVTDQEFISFQKGNLKWDQNNDKSNFEKYHQILLGMDSFSVSATYYDFEKEIDINDSTQLKYEGFHDYVDRKLYNDTYAKYQERGDTTQNFWEVYVDQVEELVLLQPLREEFYRNLIKYNYSELNKELKSNIIAIWKNQQPKAEVLESMETLITNLQRLEKGNPAPNFTYESVDGKTVSLSDFKGKLVYVDVWATWCGPCIAEQPAMEKLQKRFEGKDVVFIAVGTDQSDEPWKKMIEERKLGGIHLFSPNAWDGTIMKDYVINSIPRFILVDRDGNIVDADAARPSGDIGDQIEELLQAS